MDAKTLDIIRYQGQTTADPDMFYTVPGPGDIIGPKHAETGLRYNSDTRIAAERLTVEINDAMDIDENGLVWINRRPLNERTLQFVKVIKREAI